MPEKITGLICTFNGERLLAKTLASLDFCDHILVVDSGSTDQTVAIAEKAGAEVIFHPFEGMIAQLQFGFTKIFTPWVVTLDQDEYLSPELKRNIQQALQHPGTTKGFFIPRRSFYYDRFIMHSGWYPDHLLRLFRPDAVEVTGTLPHEEIRPLGKTEKLSGDIIHYPYRNLSEHLAKINSYTQTAAGELATKGIGSSLTKALSHGFGKFLKQYLLKKGFLDGKAGFILALHAFVYGFHKYIRIIEPSQQPAKERPMNGNVKLYALSTCIHCKNTKEFLDECNAEYDCCYVDKLEGEERARVIEEIKKVNPSLSFPTLCIGDTVIVGYKKDKIKEALES